MWRVFLCPRTNGSSSPGSGTCWVKFFGRCGKTSGVRCPTGGNQPSLGVSLFRLVINFILVSGVLIKDLSLFYKHTHNETETYCPRRRNPFCPPYGVVHQLFNPAEMLVG